MAENTGSIQIGGEIPGLTKTAYMPIRENERNIIHTDDYAKEYGMRGALIGGSTLLSYVLEMLFNYFGENWLQHGRIKVSFLGGGAINGDVVTTHGLVTAREAGNGNTRVTLDVWAVNQNQTKIVVGEASCIQ